MLRPHVSVQWLGNQNQNPLVSLSIILLVHARCVHVHQICVRVYTMYMHWVCVFVLQVGIPMQLGQGNCNAFEYYMLVVVMWTFGFPDS